MRKQLFIIVLFLCSCLCVAADVRITLRTAEVVVGTIIFQNDDVVVLKDVNGNRFQYPTTEIVKMEEINEAPKEEAPKKHATKKVGIMFQAMGGAVCDAQTWGTAAGGQVMIGANNLLQKRIFLGGGVGYHALIMDEDSYSLLPIQIYTTLPLMQTKHAPFLGLGLGYAVALSSAYKGGLYAGVDLGWRMQISEQTALFVGATATFQQLATAYKETIEDKIYTHQTTHTPCAMALKVAIQL